MNRFYFSRNKLPNLSLDYSQIIFKTCEVWLKKIEKQLVDSELKLKEGPGNGVAAIEGRLSVDQLLSSILWQTDGTVTDLRLPITLDTKISVLFPNTKAFENLFWFRPISKEGSLQFIWSFGTDSSNPNQFIVSGMWKKLRSSR